MLHLSGDPHLRNDTLDLVADMVDYHRDTGDASATGNVKATYDQQAGRKEPALGGEGPVHVTADHAQLTRYNNISIFYGAGSSLARMWQGGDAVSSPVLELDRDQQTVDAHGGRGDRGPVVHATLGAESAAPAAKPGDGKQDAAPTRLTSATLHYAGNDHRADFRGSVTAEQPTGTVRADEVDVYLTSGGPATAGAPANATGGLAKAAGAPAKASQLDHLVAIGHVLILQPGRRGTGERLVYTAADGRYVLTGGPGQPPRIVDSQKGTTTGVALIFKSADDSVEVSNHLDSGSAAPHAGSDPQARTVTDTHTPN
jgi:lipopolysaccharide export system protein LptA